MDEKHTELSDEELHLIAERCAKSSAGPWISYVEGRDHESGSSFIMTGPTTMRGNDIELIGATANDQDFIASTKQDIPRLLLEIERLKELLRNLLSG